jgi:hypothetical protein
MALQPHGKTLNAQQVDETECCGKKAAEVCQNRAAASRHSMKTPLSLPKILCAQTITM